MYYKVCLSTKINYKKLKSGNGFLVIEPDDYTNQEIKKIKSKGYKLLGYISVGTIEKERPWFNKYKKYKLQQLEDWPNEYYIDIRQKEWQNFLIKRAKGLKTRGFFGFWCDNLDVYEYNKKESMFNACKKILKELKKYGYIMVNGGSQFFDVAMDRKINLKNIVNGITQEEVFSLIKNYSKKGIFGKQKKNQHLFYISYMKKLLKNGSQTFLLQYSRDEKLKQKIKEWCKKNKMTGYYISSDVNL